MFEHHDPDHDADRDLHTPLDEAAPPAELAADSGTDAVDSSVNEEPIMTEVSGCESVDGGGPTSDDADTPSRTGKSSEVLDLIAGVESQLERMRSAQTACVEEIDSLENRRQEIELRENEIASRESGLAERAAALDGQAADLEERGTVLDQRAEAVAGELASIENRTRELDHRDEAFEQRAAGLEDERERLEVERAGLERERESFDEERIRLVNDQAAARAESAALRSRAETMESEFTALEEERERLERRAVELNDALEAMTNRVDAAESSAKDVENELVELTERLEQAASAIEARDARIREGEAALEELQAEFDGVESERSELRESRDRRELEFAELQSNLDLATDRLHALSEAVAEQAPRLEEGATAIALCRQQEQRIEELTTQLSNARNELNRAQGANDPEGLLASTREELERVRMELEAMIPLDEHRRVVASLEASRARDTDGADGTAHAELEKRLELSRTEFDAVSAHAEACETALRQAELRIAELENAAPDLEGEGGEGGERLREQAGRLADYAMHLQRRRARLKSLRSAMAVRGRLGGGAEVATAGTLEDDRRGRAMEEDLLRRQHELVDLESRMIRRWARQGTIGIVARVAVLTVALAAASWFGVRWLAPGTVSASALVKAQPVAGALMDDARGSAWNDWHRSILTDDLFAKAVATRLANLPGGWEGGTEAVKRAISDDLAVEAIQPGMLGLHLAGSDRAEAVRVLEAVVATLSAESQRQLPRRGDGARVDVQTSDGRIATLAPVPVTGRQMQYAGMVFGGSAGVLGLFGAAVYARLRRSRRLFDENLGIDEHEVL